MMLRAGVPGGRKRMSERETESEEPRAKRATVMDSTCGQILEGFDESCDLELISRVTTPTFCDVYFSGHHQTILTKVQESARPIVAALEPFGLPTPRDPGSLSVDRVKFFLKQQQKALEDSEGRSSSNEVEQDDIRRTCQLAACLYVLASFTDTLIHCSLNTALGKFATLYEKYEVLINDYLNPVKWELMQLSAREGLEPHPKLHELVRLVGCWLPDRRGRDDKVVVVVMQEFSTLSGEVLDYLQSIPDLKSCVFSFTADGPKDPIYLQAVQERFHLYDCLVVSLSAATAFFPWERVTLLIEYEQPASPLLREETLAEATNLRQYFTLRARLEGTSPASGLAGWLARDSHPRVDLASRQYTVMASENITRNGEVLQLLEGRYNMLVLERDYSELKLKSLNPKRLSYADITVDHSCSILLRPLSLLSSEAGWRALVSAVTGLSLQCQTCWVLLYAQRHNTYPYSGSVPVNLARLHAAVSHFSPRDDDYRVTVLTSAGSDEAARLVRRITEETRRASQFGWAETEWLEEDALPGETFLLLSFPCINSFSAQAMLQGHSLGQLLAMSVSQLRDNFPWMPDKIVKLFHGMCNVNCSKIAPEDMGILAPDDTGMLPAREAVSSMVIDSLNSTEIDKQGSSDFNCLNFNADLSFSTQHCKKQTEHPVSNDSSNLTGDISSKAKTGNTVCGHNTNVGTMYDTGVLRHHTACDSLPQPIMFSTVEDTHPSQLQASSTRPGPFESDLNHTHVLPLEQHADGYLFEQPSASEFSLSMMPSFNDSFLGSTVSSSAGLPCGSSHHAASNGVSHDPHIDSSSANASLLSTGVPSNPFFCRDDAGDAPLASLHSSSMTGSTFCFDSSSDSVASPLHSVHNSTTDTKHTSTSSASTASNKTCIRPSRTPSQREIRSSVIGRLSSQPISLSAGDPATRTSCIAREYYGGGCISSRFLSSSTVKRPPPPRTPVKALDLGFDNTRGGERQGSSVNKGRLHANDRVIGVNSRSFAHPTNAATERHILRDDPHSMCEDDQTLPTKNRVSSYFHPHEKASATCGGQCPSQAFPGRGTSSFSSRPSESTQSQPVSSGDGRPRSSESSAMADLKAFHFQQHQKASLPQADWTGITSSGNEPSRGGTSRYWQHQSTGWTGLEHQVPSIGVSPSTTEQSLYSSPPEDTGAGGGSARLRKLPPSSRGRRHLVYERVPGSVTGQTRLAFS